MCSACSGDYENPEVFEEEAEDQLERTHRSNFYHRFRLLRRRVYRSLESWLAMTCASVCTFGSRQARLLAYEFDRLAGECLRRRFR